MGANFTCNMDGEATKISFPPDQLHATGPAGTELKPFAPKKLATLAPGTTADYVEAYKNDPLTITDLVLLKPDSTLWLGVLHSPNPAAAVDALTDKEVLDLAYLAAKIIDRAWPGGREGPAALGQG